MSEPACSDCGAIYSMHGLDVVLDHSRWAEIAEPHELLCGTCISKRFKKLNRYVRLKMTPEYGDAPVCRECGRSASATFSYCADVCNDCIQPRPIPSKNCHNGANTSSGE